jgi:hypothetical protein
MVMNGEGTMAWLDKYAQDIENWANRNDVIPVNVLSILRACVTYPFGPAEDIAAARIDLAVNSLAQASGAGDGAHAAIRSWLESIEFPAAAGEI